MSLKKRIERIEDQFPSGEHLIVDLTEGLPPRIERAPTEGDIPIAVELEEEKAES